MIQSLFFLFRENNSLKLRKKTNKYWKCKVENERFSSIGTNINMNRANYYDHRSHNLLCTHILHIWYIFIFIHTQNHQHIVAHVRESKSFIQKKKILGCVATYFCSQSASVIVIIFVCCSHFWLCIVKFIQNKTLN